jgi:hypothetical protein
MSVETGDNMQVKLLTGYENTFFQRYWRAIRRFVGRGKQASIWVSAAIVMSINLLLGVAVSALLGETQFTTMKAILVNLMWVTYGFLMIPIFISINTRIVEFLRLRFVKSLRDESHVQELLSWASQWFGNRSIQLFISLSFGVAVALLTFYSIYPSTKFSVGQTLIYFICFFHVAVAVYGLLSVLAFTSMLDKIPLVLYSDDPASSPILLQLSKQLRDYILVFAFASAGLLLLGLMALPHHGNFVTLVVVEAYTRFVALNRVTQIIRVNTKDWRSYNGNHVF